MLCGSFMDFSTPSLYPIISHKRVIRRFASVRPLPEILVTMVAIVHHRPDSDELINELASVLASQIPHWHIGRKEFRPALQITDRNRQQRVHGLVVCPRVGGVSKGLIIIVRALPCGKLRSPSRLHLPKHFKNRKNGCNAKRHVIRPCALLGAEPTKHILESSG